MGELQVPAAAPWGAQTQRALQNFQLGPWRFQHDFIRPLALIKQAAARANLRLGLLDAARAGAIDAAAAEVASGAHDAGFPLDVFQTGSGTSTNMNANEVIAHLASSAALAVHPNDHVNLGQSSNDVIPSAIHVGAVLALREALLPALSRLIDVLRVREAEVAALVKTGRTHLMDAMPLTAGQEISGWRVQIEHCVARFQDTEQRLRRLAQGGTAVGTGVNAPPGFAANLCRELQSLTGIEFLPADNYFAAMAAQDSAVELSGQLKVLAVALMKICNDLRWMNSGPLAGLGEISLPALQPGSSIMPGKVNPVIPEAVAMVSAAVIGNDAAITLAGQSGNFQLNVMLPLIAFKLLESLQLLARAATALADQALAGMTYHAARINANLAQNPVLVTALNPLIGYEKGAAIAKQAWAEGRPILDVAAEQSGLPREQLEQLLDPWRLTRSG